MQKIPSRRRSPQYDIQKLKRDPILSVGHKAEHHKSFITGLDSSDQQAVSMHVVIHVQELSKSGRCFDSDDFFASNSFSESEELESYTFNHRDFILSVLPAERAYMSQVRTPDVGS